MRVYEEGMQLKRIAKLQNLLVATRVNVDQRNLIFEFCNVLLDREKVIVWVIGLLRIRKGTVGEHHRHELQFVFLVIVYQRYYCVLDGLGCSWYL